MRAAREQGQTQLLVLDGRRYPFVAMATPDRPRAAVLQLQQLGRHFSLRPMADQGGLGRRGS